MPNSFISNMISQLQFYIIGCLLWLFIILRCNAHQVLILVADRPTKYRHRPFRSLSSLGGTQDSCSDAVEISHVSDVHFSQRYQNLPRPWVRTDLKAKLYKSSILYYNWQWMKSLRVRGLADITVDDVIWKLESSGCMFLAWGDAVRDAILGRNPIDIDGEAACTIQKVKDICVRTFGRPNCADLSNNNSTRIIIGNPNSPVRRNELMADPLDVAQWNSTFTLPPTMWGYTANSIGLYDDQKGNVYLIDLTGRGVRDVCERKIAITAERDDWDVWMARDLHKLLSYYKLRAHGFRAASSDVRDFIVDRVKRFFTTKVRLSSYLIGNAALLYKLIHIQRMQEFYCKYVVKGTFIWRGYDGREITPHSDDFTSSCLIAPIDSSINLHMETFDELLKMTSSFQADFGEFYDWKIDSAISSMELRVLAADGDMEEEKQTESERLQITKGEDDLRKETKHGTKVLISEDVEVTDGTHINETSRALTTTTIRDTVENSTISIGREPYTRAASGDFSVSPTQSREIDENTQRQIPFRILRGDERVASSEAELGRRDVMDAKVLELSNDEIVTNRGLSLSG
uniref:Protein kinase domain-containing protein n=1 Tax=Ascaris lumbricoides TaxID=6252 RepID=A0A0M3IGA6_ASCLU